MNRVGQNHDFRGKARKVVHPNHPRADEHRSRPTPRNPWLWVPSLYYAEGIPYVIVMTVSVIMYKRLGISNTDIALYTSWLYLPWVIKPLWSPLVDVLRTKRFWIVAMQLLIGAGLAGVALTLPTSRFFQYSLAFLWLLAFSSATHDIAADGFYMLGLNQHDQAWFVGIRSTFYRLAMITGQGLLIILAGWIESHTGLPPVEITVRSNPTAEQHAWLPPDSVQLHATQEPLRLQATPAVLEIAARPRQKTEVDSIIALVRAWNAESPTPINTAAAENRDTEIEQASWWDRNIKHPLERFLRMHFGESHDLDRHRQEAGNVGIIYFYLTAPPAAGQEIVVNFGRESGDNSINLIEGSRFVFNEMNWNRPMMAAMQLDPKLRTSSSALFVARSGNIPLAWMITFLVLAGLFLAFFAYHKYVLPYPVADTPTANRRVTVLKAFGETFVSFFKKKQIGLILAFLLLYRFAEAQLVKLAPPFLLDTREIGGLALTTGEVGFVYGTVGIIALTIGGLLGGFLAARNGLKYWLWWMVIAINLPNAVYIYLSSTVPDNFLIINLCVAIEQFGYGFGFTAYMLYMIYAAEGRYKTAHFAICTGFMALGMMVPGMFSGWLQDLIGYQHFFIWVLIATIPGFLVSALIPLDAEFGKKTENSQHESQTN